ncbi:Cu-processing system ATP-binding protein [Inhella inkyongensis]|uniref:Cu-processing system ATP-binding protein n=1 Tax=Inhella inkyongensis TaxID=392593 RepID=A0A840S1I2_9BURK|nr:ABC transporter ATP-binding protein [Inhella inkyongensis]MBB5203382.1 Cu-processing system ATP-binding protein [Inhella inkyongensis]
MDAISHTDAIRLLAVRKAFGALQAVDGVDLQVPRGELFGLIGHNGAGKSTLFRIMLGLATADSGSVEVAGCAVGGPQWREARRRIGYLPEQLALYDNLNARETLAFFARLKGASTEQIEPLLARVGLTAAADRPVRTYSKGMRQRLGLAQALLGSPQVLFLDEPSNGLDPQAIREFYDLLAELRAQGVTVIITSHILAELQQRVDRLAILANGRVVAQGSVQALREQLALPLEVALRGSPALLQQAASVAGAAHAPRHQDGLLHLRCERADKMTLLARLAPLAAQLEDLQIHEPSLEDLYFGVAR